MVGPANPASSRNPDKYVYYVRKMGQILFLEEKKQLEKDSRNSPKPLVTCGAPTGGVELKFQEDKVELVTGFPGTDDKSGW
jgi:hypothetical protein